MKWEEKCEGLAFIALQTPRSVKTGSIWMLLRKTVPVLGEISLVVDK